MRVKTISFPFSLALIVILSLSLVGPALSQGSTTVTIQLALVLDGSGSISSSDWSIIITGVANAIRNNLPHDGTVEITVIQFGYDEPEYARVEVPPTVISNDTVAENVASQVESIAQSGEMTPMAHSLYLAWQTVKGSPNFDPGLKQIINLATDGEPNVRNNNATSDLDGDGDKNEYDDVIAVVNNAVAEGLDELDMEGIGIDDDARDWFRDYVLYPQPGHIAPPYTPGWIRVVADANEFAQTIGEKFQVITTPYAVVGGVIVVRESKLLSSIPLLGLASAILLATVISAIYLKVK